MPVYEMPVYEMPDYETFSIYGNCHGQKLRWMGGANEYKLFSIISVKSSLVLYAPINNMCVKN